VPFLKSFQNVTLLGYIATWYGNRKISESLEDIDKYWQWHQVSMSMEDQGVQPMGLDGIFVDQTEYAGQHLKYFEELSRNIKGRMWSTGKPGFLSFLLSHVQGLSQ